MNCSGQVKPYTKLEIASLQRSLFVANCEGCLRSNLYVGEGGLESHESSTVIEIYVFVLLD